MELIFWKSLILRIWICIWIFNQQAAAQVTCVLPGTCSTGSTPVNPGQIDVRIVFPIPTATPTVSPGTCFQGLVPCTGTISVQCGVRYAPSIPTADGNTIPGAHPWSAYIMNQATYIGSGALLDQYNVLTAAHKVASNVATPANIRIIMGVWTPLNLVGLQSRNAVRIIIHPSYNPVTLVNDIAIVRVNAPYPLGTTQNINTACLPTQGASYVGQNCILAGWGQSTFGVPVTAARAQRQVTLPIVSYATCRAALSQTSLGANTAQFLDPVGEICAGGVANRDACTDDGGAPLMCLDARTGRYTVAGLVIWGKGCGQAGVYGVYVSVPNYRTWIDSSIAQLNAG